MRGTILSVSISTSLGALKPDSLCATNPDILLTPNIFLVRWNGHKEPDIAIFVLKLHKEMDLR